MFFGQQNVQQFGQAQPQVGGSLFSQVGQQQQAQQNKGIGLFGNNQQPQFPHQQGVNTGTGLFQQQPQQQSQTQGGLFKIGQQQGQGGGLFGGNMGQQQQQQQPMFAQQGGGLFGQLNQQQQPVQQNLVSPLFGQQQSTQPGINSNFFNQSLQSQQTNPIYNPNQFNNQQPIPYFQQQNSYNQKIGSFKIRLDKNNIKFLPKNVDNNMPADKKNIATLSVNFCNEFRGKTLEEIRIIDYQIIKQNLVPDECKSQVQNIWNMKLQPQSVIQQPQIQKQQGLFGQNQQQQQQAVMGLFGNQQTQQQPVIFGANQQQNNNPAPLFQTSNNPQQQGGLFGQTQTGLFNAQQPLQQQQQGGLFNQQVGVGLFGNQQNQQQQQQQQQQPQNIFQFPNQQQPAQQPQNNIGGGLFSNINQPAPGGLFNNQQSQPQTGLLNNNLQSQQPQQQQQLGGLFGNLNNNNTNNNLNNNNQQQGSLFSNIQQPQQQQQQLGGLFGNLNNNQQQGQTNLLGNNNQQQQQNTGLFSNINTGNQQQGGLFGNNNQQQPLGDLFKNNQQQQNNNPTSLFGNINQQNNQSGNQTGLFGNTSTNNQTQPNTQTGLFNQSSNVNNTSSLFSNLNNPQQSNNNPQQQQNQQPSNSLFNTTPSTGLFANNNTTGLFANNNQSSLFGNKIDSKSDTNQPSSLFCQPSIDNKQQSNQPLFSNQPNFLNQNISQISNNPFLNTQNISSLIQNQQEGIQKSFQFQNDSTFSQTLQTKPTSINHVFNLPPSDFYEGIYNQLSQISLNKIEKKKNILQQTNLVEIKSSFINNSSIKIKQQDKKQNAEIINLNDEVILKKDLPDISKNVVITRKEEISEQIQQQYNENEQVFKIWLQYQIKIKGEKKLIKQLIEVERDILIEDLKEQIQSIVNQKYSQQQQDEEYFDIELILMADEKPQILKEDKALQDYVITSNSTLMFSQQAVKEKKKVQNKNYKVQQHQLPKLTKEGYKIQPTLQQLSQMTSDQLKEVPAFVIENEFGSIAFTTCVDLTNLDLDRIVDIKHKSIQMYEDFDDSEKPQVGQQLNQPAIMTFKQFEVTKINGQSMPLDKFMNRMIKTIHQQGLEFLSFDQQKSILKVKVQHF